MKYYVLFLFCFLVSSLQAQRSIPTPDTTYREEIHFYDFNIRESENYTKLQYRESSDNPQLRDKKYTGKFLYIDSNGIRVYMELKDNVASGYWERYTSTFEGPIIDYTTHFADGRKNGEEFKYSYYWSKEDSTFVSYVSEKIEYNMGRKEYGEEYHKDGSLKNKYTVPHGAYNSYYESNRKESEGEYDEGVSVGLWKHYYDMEGSPIKRIDEYVRENYRIVHSKEFYSDGKLKSLYTTRNLIYDGALLELDEYGDTIKYHFYKDGLQQGYQIKNKKDQSCDALYIIRYNTDEDGLVVGKYTETYLNTNLPRVIGSYNKSGERDGAWEFYHTDGRLYQSDIYCNGLRRAGCKIELHYPRTDKIIYNYIHLEKFQSGKIERLKEVSFFFLFSE